jgi:hypothetical protein
MLPALNSYSLPPASTALQVMTHGRERRHNLLISLDRPPFAYTSAVPQVRMVSVTVCCAHRHRPKLVLLLLAGDLV